MNSLYGSAKVISGIALLTIGTAADLTGIGALVGVPLQAYGIYQIVTGLARFTRGQEQILNGQEQPTVCKSPLE